MSTETVEKYNAVCTTIGIIAVVAILTFTLRGCVKSHDEHFLEMEKQSLEKLRLELEMKKAKIAEIIANHEAKKLPDDKQSNEVSRERSEP